jgi:pimeloyl-ACP methyl ester carboxylesterase
MKLRRALYILAAVVLLILGGAWFFGSVAAEPHLSAVAPPKPPGQVIHLVTSDDVQLEGSYWPGRRADGPAILLLHGINSSRASFSRHALWLNGLGYAVLAIDFRGHGGSAAVPRTFGLHEARDAAAAVRFLRAKAPQRRIGVIGTSLGGAAALLGDHGPLPVQAMVLQAVYPDIRDAIRNRIARIAGRPLAWVGEPLLSYQSWLRYRVSPNRISPINGLRLFHGPVLVIGGTADRNTTVSDTISFYEAAAGPKQLWLLPGVGHAATGSVFTDEYRRRVRLLFEKSLGPT